MDTIDPLRFALAFVFILGLIGVMALVLRHYTPAQKLLSSKDGEGRLQVIEVKYVDARRKLALIRRDKVEHLVLLSDGRETVIESNIPAQEKSHG